MIFIRPGSNNSNKRGGGIFFVLPFFDQVKKILLAKTLRIIVLFTQRFVIKLQKIGFWDPGHGKKQFRIPVQKGTGSRFRVRNTVPVLDYRGITQSQQTSHAVPRPVGALL
jgi:hypothetical protein